MIWNGLRIYEYDGLIHGWTYIWNAVNVSNVMGLCTGGGLYWGAGLIVGGILQHTCHCYGYMHAPIHPGNLYSPFLVRKLCVNAHLI